MSLSLVSLGVAFGGGLASVLSPCVLPLIPSYLTTMAGTALTREAVENRRIQRRVMQNAILFVAGFSTVLVLAGLGASALGQFFQFHRHVIAQLRASTRIKMSPRRFRDISISSHYPCRLSYNVWNPVEPACQQHDT